MKFTFLENTKKIFDFKKIVFFWFAHHKALFFICFLLVFSYGSYSWYAYLHRYQWSEEKKKEFLVANFKETAFKESKFKDVIDRLLKREQAHAENVILRRDILEGKNLQ